MISNTFIEIVNIIIEGFIILTGVWYKCQAKIELKII